MYSNKHCTDIFLFLCENFLSTGISMMSADGPIPKCVKQCLRPTLQHYFDNNTLKTLERQASTHPNWTTSGSKWGEFGSLIKITQPALSEDKPWIPHCSQVPPAKRFHHEATVHPSLGWASQAASVLDGQNKTLLSGGWGVKCWCTDYKWHRCSEKIHHGTWAVKKGFLKEGPDWETGFGERKEEREHSIRARVKTSGSGWTRAMGSSRQTGEEEAGKLSPSWTRKGFPDLKMLLHYFSIPYVGSLVPLPPDL